MLLWIINFQERECSVSRFPDLICCAVVVCTSGILSVLGTHVQKHCLAEVAVLVGKSGQDKSELCLTGP